MDEPIDTPKKEKYAYLVWDNGYPEHVFTTYKKLASWIMKDIKGKRHARGIDMTAELTPLLSNEIAFVEKCNEILDCKPQKIKLN